MMLQIMYNQCRVLLICLKKEFIMKIGLLGIVVCSLVLAGCVSPGKGGVANQGNVPVANGSDKTEFKRKNSLRPLPVYEYPVEDTAGTLDDEVNALSMAREYYKDVVVSLYSTNYRSSDTSYFGSILALVGGATKSVETTVVGGLLGAGGEIVPSRYQTAVQAEHYYALSKVYDCMVKEYMNHPKEALVKGDAVTSLDVATHIWRLRGNLNYRLFERQKSVTLQAVSLDKLKAALSQLEEHDLSDTDDSGNAKAASVLLFEASNNLKSQLSVCAAEY